MHHGIPSFLDRPAWTALVEPLVLTERLLYEDSGELGRWRPKVLPTWEQNWGDSNLATGQEQGMF